MVLIKYFRYLILHTLKIEESLYLFGFKIKLPRNSKLPIYREKFKNYDLFLHFIVKDFKRDGVVLDIGANVGDTFFPMYASNKNLNYFLIEPNIYFGNLLKINLCKNNIHKKVSTWPLFISTKKNQPILFEKNGTSFPVNETSQNSFIEYKIIRLDSFIKSRKIKKISLIKIDVDGYDFDVINSGMKYIENNLPLIFFECDTSINRNVKDYLQTIKNLFAVGYLNFFFFDNYGNFFAQSGNFDELKEWLLSVDSNKMLNLKKDRIYYFDILAVSQIYTHRMQTQVNNYKSIAY